MVMVELTASEEDYEFDNVWVETTSILFNNY